MSVELSEFLVPKFFDVQVQRTDEKILFLSAAGRILASVRAPNVWKYVSEASLMHFSMEMNKISYKILACGGLIWESVELSECRVK